MFNWVGNKLKYKDLIFEKINNKDIIVDPMMGSGNILLELLKKNKTVIGNDIVPLMPTLFKNAQNYNFSEKDIKSVLDHWNNFSNKEEYYRFRDYWNIHYENGGGSKNFLIETFLLLKMCSNSMVRFNQHGKFNQGFRGLGKKITFFDDKHPKKFEIQLKLFIETIKNGKNKFISIDVLELLDTLKKHQQRKLKDMFFIFDPPYLLETGTYSRKKNSYTLNTELEIYKFIEEEKVNFVFFNYIHRDGKEHLTLKKWIEKNNFKYEEISSKTSTGQGRTNSKEISEIIVYG